MKRKFNSLDDIDDAISDWHEDDTADPLHVYLGMTWHEYALFVTNRKKFWDDYREKHG